MKCLKPNNMKYKAKWSLTCHCLYTHVYNIYQINMWLYEENCNRVLTNSEFIECRLKVMHCFYYDDIYLSIYSSSVLDKNF
jgi:hypothetical protein